ncbi:hypothetical protein NDU88_008757 [Pleurodeles waltl]|uniref:Uncharacterized protein n=1 Tax=Pleurodeles waltl TaxID=8319 RepID=A0AAV7NE17_PLEWA|nr:hypothetical protein NDU88_008757 [Pleurodeles waltl]
MQDDQKGGADRTKRGRRTPEYTNPRGEILSASKPQSEQERSSTPQDRIAATHPSSPRGQEGAEGPDTTPLEGRGRRYIGCIYHVPSPETCILKKGSRDMRKQRGTHIAW